MCSSGPIYQKMKYELDHIESEVRQLTFEHTCQLTALYACQIAYNKDLQSLKSSPLNVKSSLVIHVVGARQAETLDLTRWEIFFHCLPRLKNLCVVFVGPELV